MMRDIFEGLVFFTTMLAIGMAFVFLSALNDPMWESFVR